MRWNVVVLNRDYVMYCEAISINHTLQVHTESLDRNVLSARNLQFLVGELEFRN